MRTHVVVDDDGQEQAATAAVAPVALASAPLIVPRFALGMLPLIAPPADSRRVPVAEIVSEERDAQVRCPLIAVLQQRTRIALILPFISQRIGYCFFC